jgi:hypothetical protein
MGFRRSDKIWLPSIAARDNKFDTAYSSLIIMTCCTVMSFGPVDLCSSAPSRKIVGWLRLQKTRSLIRTEVAGQRISFDKLLANRLSYLRPLHNNMKDEANRIPSRYYRQNVYWFQMSRDICIRLNSETAFGWENASRSIIDLLHSIYTYGSKSTNSTQ